MTWRPPQASTWDRMIPIAVIIASVTLYALRFDLTAMGLFLFGVGMLCGQALMDWCSTRASHDP